MSEFSSEVSIVDFSSTEPDMSKIELEDWGPGEDRYVFVAPDLAIARKIGYRVTEALQLEQDSQKDDVRTRFTKPELVDDLRLDGGDTSYSEERIDEGIEVQLYLRDYRGREPFSSRLRDAVSAVFQTDKNGD